MVTKGSSNQIGPSRIRGNGIPFQTHISCRPPFHPTHAGNIGAVHTDTLIGSKSNARGGIASTHTAKAHDDADDQGRKETDGWLHSQCLLRTTLPAICKTAVLAVARHLACRLADWWIICRLTSANGAGSGADGV